MSQFVGDYIRSQFRSLHDSEPLNEEDVNWLVSEVRKKFPNKTREEIINNSPFKIAELKEFRFHNSRTIEAYSIDEAIEKFSNSSENFAADADIEEL